MADAPTRRQRLATAIAGFDARLRALSHYAIDLSRPGPALLAELRRRGDQMRRQHADLEAARRDADALLPELLDLYRNGDDSERQWLRGLLAQHESFRWGFGWTSSAAIATAEQARDALAVLSMKDGGRDWRDQIVALDHLCAAMRRAGLPVAALLAEAAAWSSEVPRFANAASTRALLRRYAERFA